MTTAIYHPVPRVSCPTPLGLSFPVGTTDFPVRARDDLDPHDPPLEYQGGRISWSGHPTREARDAYRAELAAGLEQRRSDPAHGAVREYARLSHERFGLRECLRNETVDRERGGAALAALDRALENKAHVPHDPPALYRAGLCWYPHPAHEQCAGCRTPSGEAGAYDHE